MKRIRVVIDRLTGIWRRSLPGAVVTRYSSHRGGLLANGLAYSLLFAFFAGLWTILSIAGLVVSGNHGLQHALLDAINRIVPGIAETVASTDALSRISGTLTWTGLVTLLSFIWSITGWMDSLRIASRTMFDDHTDELDTIHAKLWDLLAVSTVFLLLLLSTAAGAVSGGAVRAVFGLLGMPAYPALISFLVDALGLFTGFLLNLLLFVILLRLVVHIRRGRSTLLGSAIGALAFSITQLLGARLLGGAGSNPLLAPFAAIIGVLLWFNIMAQIILYCAAFIAEARERYGHDSGRHSRAHAGPEGAGGEAAKGHSRDRRSISSSS